MIKKLTIKNYEGHKNTTLELSPGLNVLVGESDAGKSAVLRSLNWVISNRPLGEEMRPLYWEGETEVKIEFDNFNELVSRVKGKTNNYYAIGGKKLKGYGTTVPEEIKVITDLGEINYQSQIDLPFLVFESPATRAQLFNEVAGISDIDSTLTNAKSDIRRKNNDLKTAKTQLEDLQSQLKELPDLDRIEELLIGSESIEKEIRANIQKKVQLNRLIKLHDKIQQQKKSIRIYRNESYIDGLIDDIQKGIENIDKLKKKHKKIKYATGFLWGIIDDKKHFENILDQDKLFISIESTFSKHKKQLTVYNSLELKVEKCKEIKKEIQQQKKLCEKLEEELPKICPTCKQYLQR